MTKKKTAVKETTVEKEETTVEEVTVEEQPEVEEVRPIVVLAANGTVLECQAVQGGVLQSLLADLALLDEKILDDPAALALLGGKDRANAIKASEKLFDYCAGWGVKNNPPAQVPEVVKLMGVDPLEPNLYRAAWVRYALGATQAELGFIVGMVLTLSFRGSPDNENLANRS